MGERVSLSDALRLIVWGHRRLIVVLVVLGAALGALGARTRPLVYAADLRIDLEGSAPRSTTESAVLSSKALAIATSRETMAAASSVSNTPALKPTNIDVSSLGGSGVLRVTVKASRPEVAAAQANALGDLIIGLWDAGARSQYAAALADLDQQAAAVRAQVAALDAQIDAILAKAPSTPGPGSNEIPALTATLDRRNEAVQRSAAIELQRRQLVSQQDGSPGPRVIQAATEPDSPEPRGVPLNIFLGAVLAGLLAVTLAAVTETLRPSVVGAEAQSEVLGTPRLGGFRLDFGGGAATEAAVLAHRIAVAARAEGLSSVVLLSLGRPPRTRRFRKVLLDGLRWRLTEARLETIDASTGVRRGTTLASQLQQVALHVAGRSVAQATDRNPAGVVVLSGPSANRSNLVAIADLHWLDDTTLLGLATFDWQHRFSLLRLVRLLGVVGRLGRGRSGGNGPGDAMPSPPTNPFGRRSADVEEVHIR